MAVLQITVPLPVLHDHLTALHAWAGRGAVKMFAQDATIRATLIELCVPGTDAADLAPAEADDIAADILPQPLLDGGRPVIRCRALPHERDE